MSTLRENDVVRYQPDNNWCHEGLAIVYRDGSGDLVLCDTYWGSGGTVVAPSSFEVLFNLDDYEPAQQRDWDRRAPEDRQVVSHQHGLQRNLYIRKGSPESRDQIVANARAALQVAEEAVASAVRERDWCQRQLDELEPARC